MIEDIHENNDDALYGDEFSFYVVTAGGKIAAEYCWNRSYDYDNTTWNDDGEWVKGAGKSDISSLVPGEGIYATCGKWTEGCGFQTAGKALVEARNIPFKDGKFIMSNPLSKSVDIVDIWPIGYEDNEELIEDIHENNDDALYGDEFSFYAVTPGGKIAAEYSWNRSYDYENSVWNDDGEWVKGAGKSEITTIASGEAIYTTCGKWTEGCAMSFPGLDDQHLAE